MKVVLLGTALLACSIPAFGQVDTTLQSSSPWIPGACEAALTTPGVPSAVVVVPVPTLMFPAGEVIGSPQLRAPHPRTMPSSLGTGRRSSRPGGVVAGGGTIPGIGSMQSSGIGTMTQSGVGTITQSGVGTMTQSGVGSIGMGGIGSIPTPGLGLPPTPSSPSSPFAFLPAPSSAVGAASRGARAGTHARPGAPQQLPFFCP